MGTNYAVSWLQHRIYLFHSVPVDSKGNYIASETDNLLYHTGALDYQFLTVIGYTLKHFLEPFLLVLQSMFINKVVDKIKNH